MDVVEDGAYAGGIGTGRRFVCRTDRLHHDGEFFSQVILAHINFAEDTTYPGHEATSDYDIILATYLAMARAAVSPGDSIPIRFIKPGKPAFSSWVMTKSRKSSPGP